MEGRRRPFAQRKACEATYGNLNLQRFDAMGGSGRRIVEAGMSMNRWNARLAVALLVAAGLAGCGQKLYMTPSEKEHYTQDLGLPDRLEADPHLTILPSGRLTAAPTTVNDTERPLRYMSLPEAIAIALEQGNIGSQSSLFPGIVNDNLLQFNGRFVGLSDSIRVLSLDPAIAGADIDASLAKFDMRWITSTTWGKRDDATGNILQSFQNGDNASMSTGLYKFLPTGGVAGITLSNDYSFLTNPPQNAQVFTNPTHKPRAQVAFEQPLLQGLGVEINQLLVAHPGAFTISGARSPGGGRVEGVLITRLRYDQSRVEFERNVNFLLLNVEYAYWNLYGSYYTLFSREQGMRQAFEAYKLNKARFEAGALPEQDLQQTRAQYELFRGQRITALGQVLDRERQLRGLLGLPVEDGKRIVPSDSPTLAEFKPDWTAALTECMSYRPELILSRQDLKFRQLDLLLQKNFLKPDLRFFANYDINGIGTRLDGSADYRTSTDGFGNTTTVPGNALATLADNDFNTWNVGLRLDVPLGFRDSNAAVRVARLNLARSYYQLKDQERKAEALLAVNYREIQEYYETIETNRAQREANARQLELRFQQYKVGKGTLDVLLEAQRNFADSLASEFLAITNYNSRLAGFHFSKGTLMSYDGVQISDGPMPAAAQVRAVEHQRRRSLALEVRQRPALQPGGPSAHEPMYGNMPPLSDLPVTKPNASSYPPGTEPPAAIPLPPPTPMPTQGPAGSVPITATPTPIGQ